MPLEKKASESFAAEPPVSGAEGPSVEPRVDDEPGVESATLAADDDTAAAEPEPSADEVTAPPPTVGAAPVVQGDWLASVCPYLASDDGTYRSAAPDEGHRCTAQDPAATLPLAFQERYCLTDRHPRCEMYKFAQEADSSGPIPAAQVPPTDPPTPRTRRIPRDGPGRPLIMAGAGIGIIILIVVLVLLVSSCGGEGGSTVDPEASVHPQATEAPAATPEPTPEPTPTPEPEPTPEPDPDATPDETAEGATETQIRILYEIQPDEALLRISETFGVSRNRIRRENPGLEDIAPADMPGTVIELPITGDMTLEAAEALPGYQGIAP